MESASRSIGPGLRAEVRFTAGADGDFGLEGDRTELAARRARVIDRPWTWVRQSHGAGVAVAHGPGDAAGAEADAAVTTVPGAPVSVLTADCVPIALLGRPTDGASGIAAIAAVHAGWRGLVAGVVEAAADAMRSMGAGSLEAIVGPHIGTGGYAFGAEDLAAVAAAVGAEVAGVTCDGSPALDLEAAVRACLRSAGVTTIDFVEGDTAEPHYFSHRTRGDTGRQALVAWLEVEGVGR